MSLDLTLNETRVLGSLIEKEITTPDQYPLTLNSLTNACNQKSNREPVLNLSETEVQNTLDDLIKKRLVMEDSRFSSRVAKFKHRFCNTEFSELQFSEQQLGIICVLFLRGPQTPGELRSRTNRLCQFNDVNEVESTLQGLATLNPPLVIKLPREAGKRESRYAHLFSGEPEHSQQSPPVSTSDTHMTDKERIITLENQVQSLQAEIEQIKNRINQLE